VQNRDEVQFSPSPPREERVGERRLLPRIPRALYCPLPPSIGWKKGEPSGLDAALGDENVQ